MPAVFVPIPFISIPFMLGICMSWWPDGG
jgi:hypothetical protein